MNNGLETIGQRITFALALQNIKQKDLAKHLGVTDNTISYFCNDRRSPNTNQIVKIAQYLNVSTDYLFGLTNTIANDVELLSTVCNYTGLSKESVLFLHKLKEDNNMIYSQKGVDIISTVLESLSNTIK